MNEQIIKIKEEMISDINLVNDINGVNDIKVKYMGKKGLITDLMKMMGELSPEQKKDFGKSINELKEYFNSNVLIIEERLKEEGINRKLNNEKIDITLPATQIRVGGVHPIVKIVDELEELFVSMGYSVVSGPEVESDLYNFEMLNLPKEHPARDSQDSFYITNDTLLRTQTSAVQVRSMLANQEKKPFKIICPGNTYRRDSDDATHSHQFMQMEGLVVQENVSLADLKGTLEVFVKRFFGEERVIRFRPSFFPFTEPSYEVDVSCFKCGGVGCPLCKNTGWIEILGSGMVHPNVLNACGFDSNKYVGFAFGIGIERVAMLKYGINDIRDFYTNDLRFLSNYDRMEGGNK
ncbi:MAG: phenylalanine--tRNA ligase subunit alpha [Bacilli bacterium]|nr:phenylalanine--tRNA ligase subunit alpha [Bacilli bacterium]